MPSPETLAASVTALAVMISEGRSNDDLALLSTIFMQLGDTLTTISTQRNILESKGKS